MPTVNLTDAETALCAELAAETGLPPLLVSRFRQMWVTREAPFFAAVSEETDEFRYWTSPLASGAPELLARLPDFERLHDAEAGRGLPTDPRGPSLWVGSANSATQAHYDVADNVLVALHGAKRLRCWPPSAAGKLHVFPDAHPRARKSQVNFDQPDHARFPLFAGLPPPSLDVTLEPGDALLLPAFWFHHVENDPLGCAPGWLAGAIHPEAEWLLLSVCSPSVSMNLFAPSAALLASQPAASRMREAEAMQARAACEIAVLQREVGVSERQV